MTNDTDIVAEVVDAMIARGDIDASIREVAIREIGAAFRSIIRRMAISIAKTSVSAAIANRVQEPTDA